MKLKPIWRVVLVVIVALLVFLGYRKLTAKQVENIQVDQYSYISMPVDKPKNIVFRGKSMSLEAYEEYVDSLGYENIEGKLTVLDAIEVVDTKKVYAYSVNAAERRVDVRYRGQSVNEGDLILVSTPTDLDELIAKHEVFKFGEWFADDQAIETIGNIDFDKEGVYEYTLAADDAVRLNFKVEVSTTFENQTNTDDTLILVNRKRGLSPDFVPDLKEIPTEYAVSDGYRATPSTTDAFVDMVDAMFKETGLCMYATSSYRSYEFQEELYWGYVAQSGKEEADRYSAPPGFSEHQTGLVIDVVTPGGYMDDFGLTEQSTWVNKNAHRFGFIVRYPEGKEEITGYMPEAWHLRYIGPKAEDVYKSGLTYDEWYLKNVE